MSTEGGHMTDVELVSHEPGEDGRAPGRGRRRRRGVPTARSRRGRLRGLAALVVLGLVVGLGGLAEHRAARTDAALARSVAPSGAVHSLREPVRELWRATGQVVGGGGGVLVLAETGEAGTVLSGRGARSGEVLWTREIAPASVRCPRTLDSDAGTSAVVLCEVRARPVHRTGSGVLWILDPTDGTVQGRRTLDGRLAGWDVVDGDLVLARQTGRDLTVWREGLTDGTQRWATVLAMPDGVSATQVELRVGGDLVALGGGMGAVLTPDGDLLGRWERGRRGAVAVRTDSEGFAVWTDAGEGRWFDRSGRAGVRLPGEPVDGLDGAPGTEGSPFVGEARSGMPEGLILLRTRGGIAVADTRGHGLLWSRGARRAGEIVVVGGVAVLASRSEVRLVDLRDGRPGWAVERGLGTDTGTVLTDGLRVLVPGAEVGGGRTVTAHSLADGRAEWAAPLPAGAVRLDVGPGGVLLARVPGGVAVVGP